MSLIPSTVNTHRGSHSTGYIQGWGPISHHNICIIMQYSQERELWGRQWRSVDQTLLSIPQTDFISKGLLQSVF